MSYYNFDKLDNLKDGDILFFDELLNGNPVVLNACLTILEQRRFISGKPLPNIMIVAAANPQGMVPITPQIKERFIWYKVKFNAPMWQEFMYEKYSMIKKVSKKLCELIDGEEFKGDNFMSPRSLDKATNMIINEVSTPYQAKIQPILDTPIENKLDGEVELPDGGSLERSEMTTWLNLIKMSKGINIINKLVDGEISADK